MDAVESAQPHAPQLPSSKLSVSSLAAVPGPIGSAPRPGGGNDNNKQMDDHSEIQPAPRSARASAARQQDMAQYAQGEQYAPGDGDSNGEAAAAAAGAQLDAASQGDESAMLLAEINPLHYAAAIGDRRAVQEMLRLAAEGVAINADQPPQTVHTRDPYGRTPLIYAVISDRLTCAKALLEAGSSVNDVDKAGSREGPGTLRTRRVGRQSISTHTRDHTPATLFDIGRASVDASKQQRPHPFALSKELICCL